MTKQHARSWLAGFIDGEGCVYYRDLRLPNGRRQQSRVLTISNTDPALMEHVCACYDVLGIRYSRSNRANTTAGRKHIYTAEVRRGADLARILELIPIQAAHKLERLQMALANYRYLKCLGCGCRYDDRTAGCLNCRKRHSLRSRHKATLQE